MIAVCSGLTALLGNGGSAKRLSRPDGMQQVRRLLSALLLVGILTLLAPVGLAVAHDTVHVVQPGETLSEIAKRYGVATETLRLLNDLSDADFVWVGQPLALPADVVTDSTTDAAELTDVAVYIVQPNDTLSAIAVAHRIALAQLVELNRISPAQRLYVGQSLYVPANVAGVARAGSADEPMNNSAGPPGVYAPVVHVVQRGEQVGVIANQYGVSVRAIARANNLVNASLITPGQRLVIPTPDFADQPAGTMPDGNAFHIHESFPTTTEKWIDVDLSEQRVVAYEGTTAVKAFIISSGLPGTPTVTGTFRIWAKTPLQDMYGGNRAAGDYYYLKDVQWVQYFYQDYAFHGAYWHNNFGQPMSRGCINMRNEDAQWLFDWASPVMTGRGWLFSANENPGTLVVVHE